MARSSSQPDKSLILKSLWDKNVAINYLLTVEGNEQREIEFFESMRHLGLTRDKFIIIKSKKAKDKSKIDKDICQTHYNVTEHAMKNYPNKVFAIYEDDCRVIDNIEKAQEILIKVLQYTFREKNMQKWILLNLGGVSLGPSFPSTLHKNIVLSSFPWAAHSYLLNGFSKREKIAKLMKNHGNEKWKQPFAVEGWSNFKPTQKWMVNPGITHQCVIPRLQALLPVARRHAYQDIVPNWNAAIYASTGILAVSIIILAFAVIWAKTHKKKKLKHKHETLPLVQQQQQKAS